MIVYGDRIERVRTRDGLARIIAALEALAGVPAGIRRHGALADAFIALGQIVQGIVDADREELGADGGSAAERMLLGPLGELAAALDASWLAIDRGDDAAAHSSEAERATDTQPQRVPAIASGLRAMLLGATRMPEHVELRLPEGHAFYALYPEAYAAAARRLELAGAPRVIGIRSIGTGLGAIVAAALGAPAPLTVRPVGHPFDRRIVLTVAAEAELIDGASHYVVVDEGPGLSGSSFAAVAGYLEARGIAASRIAFLPSHGGEPGAKACERTRTRWAAAQRPVVAVDELIPPGRLAGWLEPLIGRVEGPIEDVSGGGWRGHVFGQEAAWPAVDPAQERRKFLVRAGGGRWLVKFAGLGGECGRKVERARLLHAAGLVPEVRGCVHGFLVQRWVDARPIDRHAGDLPELAGRYLGMRARLLPPSGSGASLAELSAMARFNIGRALGEETAEKFAAACPDLVPLEEGVRRMATDNRCDPHEWLRLADGSVVKADALDHDVGHDLIGAQDLAWDVAGVASEFGLSAGARERLIRAVEEAAGRPIRRDLRAFLTPCYLAFRLGAAQMAADALGGWPEEEARNRAAVAVYAGKLAALLTPAGRSRPAMARS